MKKVLIPLFLLLLVFPLFSQNIAITDDNAYTANSSAMLDVKSLTKGLLVPRMTSVQRTSIVSPATGLLVFDTNINGFYYYNGSAWINLTSGSSTGPFWSYNSPNIYTTNTGDYVGIGTTTPTGKLTIQGGGVNSLFFEYGGIYDAHMGLTGYDLEIFSADDMRLRVNEQNSAGAFEIYDDFNNDLWMKIVNGNVGIGTASPGRKLVVQANPSSGIDEAIFAVQNQNGDTVFAVYNEGVRVWVDDNGGTKANGSRGGFAVGGFSPTKAGFTNEYLRVTPDSVRVYINDDYVPAKANGSRGGFAVGGFNPAKGAPSEHYLFVQDDSTRVYVADSLEGFGVENIEAANDQRIMRLTTQNYFIGHESGVKITNAEYNSIVGYKSGFNLTSGDKNSFFGYESGINNNSGYENCFIGFQAGRSNTSGFRNVFIGPQAGYSNTTNQFSVFIGYRAGYYSNSLNNVFIGNDAGRLNTSGTGNTFLGNMTGQSNTSGSFNTHIGFYAGQSIADGDYNVYIGPLAGMANDHGSNNVFVGYAAGNNSSGSGNVFLGNSAEVTGSNRLAINNGGGTSLIYGEFDNDRVGINDEAPSANLHIKQVGTNEEGFAIENDENTNTWSWEVSSTWLYLAYNGTNVGYWNNTSGAYVSTSDKRLKKDIEVVNESLLSKVMNLEVVNYRLKDANPNSKKVYGFIAQDVQELFPELVQQEEEGGFLGLNYDDFGIIAIKVIQEQQEIINSLIERIEKLENK